MSHYLVDGDSIFPTTPGAYDVRTQLPVGTYTVCLHPMRGFFLKAITDFEIKGKVYGETNRYADRILNTFADRPNTTGVLLNGEKGSGKTMLAKLVSQKAAEQGISTLVINTAYVGDAFNTFIQNINQACVILFDEFEKVFDEKEQEATLTLLDGVYPTKKLFILTVNDKYRVNQHMRNRPGRLFYMLDFQGLDKGFIEEYCLDNLVNKSHIGTICRMTMLFESFNFDMLKALVEEMNRYNESPQQAMRMLNAKPIEQSYIRHNIQVFKNGQLLPESEINPTQYRGNPLSKDELEICVKSWTNREDDDYEWQDVVFGQNSLKRIDANEGTFIYVIGEGTAEETVVKFIREPVTKPSYSWMDAF